MQPRSPSTRLFEGRQVTVVGHAPDVRLPEQMDALVACNASLGLVHRVDAWVTTTHMFNKYLESKGNGRAKGEFIRGSHARAVYLYLQHHPRAEFEDACRALEVTYDDVHEMTEPQRFDFVESVCGVRVNVSTGVLGALVALSEGASAVVMAGISFALTGYAGLSDESCAHDVKRNHLHDDQACMAGLIARYPDRLFTTDTSLLAVGVLPWV